MKNGYAVKAMDHDYYDLVMSDIMMPVMEGYEFVRRLRDSGSTTPVIMITAKDAFCAEGRRLFSSRCPLF